MMKMESRIIGLLCEKDQASRIVRCNSVFLEYAGVQSANQVLGHTDYDFPWQEYADTYRKHELDVLAGNNHSIIFPSKTAQGEYSVFLHNKAARHDDAGNIIGIQCHAVEIMHPKIHQLFAQLSAQTPETVQQKGYTRGKNKIFDLTPREKDILFFLCKAKTAKQIALILNISPRTIYSHIEHLKQKLNCHTKGELVDAAYQTGFSHELPSQIALIDLIDHLQGTQ